MVVDQLAERLLPTYEVRGSNSVIGKLYITYILSATLKMTKSRKRGREWPILKTKRTVTSSVRSAVSLTIGISY